VDLSIGSGFFKPGKSPRADKSFAIVLSGREAVAGG
jgi:hypothetical protein